MTVITARMLSRETARVLRELPNSAGGVDVTQDGVLVARLVPVSPLERELYERLAARGVDIHNPPAVDPTWKMGPPASPGEKTASDYLMEDRDSYYEGS